MLTMKPLVSRFPLLVLFIFSGFSGLVFEVVWVRLASLALGVTVYAVSVVVSTFMAGLALGGLIAGRVGDKRALGLRTYAGLEILICLSGVLATWLLSKLQLLSASNFFGSFVILESLLASLLLLLPCTLMGATVPVLSRAVFLKEAPSRIIGLLYGANIVGAVAGALLADFVLIPGIGVLQAAMTAGAVNALAGTAALFVASKVEGEERASEEEPEGSLSGLIYLVYGLVGFCALALQLVWVRLLVVLVYTNVYAFSVLLATYLALLSLGTAAASPWSSKTKVPATWVLHGICGMSLMTLLSIIWFGQAEAWVGSNTFPTLTGLFDSILAGRGWFIAPSLLRCLILFGLPTFLSGAIFPFICALALKYSQGISKPVGYLYSANTLGAIFGSLLGGFLLLPQLGVQGSISLLSFVLLLCGILTFRLVEAQGRNFSRVTLVLTAAGCVGFVLLPGDWLFKTINLPHYQRAYSIEPSTVKYNREDLYGTIAVSLDTERDALIVNATHMMGSTMRAKRYAYLMAHLPMALSKKPRRALIICFGLGMTFGAVASYDELESAQCVELSPAVLEFAPHFGVHNFEVATRQDKKVELINNDGRNFLLRTDQRYDLISFEPPPPSNPGVVNLYSADYYELCKERLTDNGVVCQWLPLHDLSEEGARMVVRTFLEVFPQATLWEGADDDLILVGGKKDASFDFERFQQLGSRPGMSDIGIRDGYDLLATFLQGPEALRAYSASAPVVTDNHPYLEYDLGKNALAPQIRGRDFEALKSLLGTLSPEQEQELGARVQDWATLSALNLPQQEHPIILGLKRYQAVRILQPRFADNPFAVEMMTISEKALVRLRKRVEGNPNHPILLRNLGTALLLAREHDEARAVLSKLLQLRPDFVLGHFFLGLVEWESGNSGDVHFNKGLQMIPDPNLRKALITQINTIRSVR